MTTEAEARQELLRNLERDLDTLRGVIDTESYDAGVAGGKHDGDKAGYTRGYDEGKTYGLEQGRREGQEDGYERGYRTGFDAAERGERRR